MGGALHPEPRRVRRVAALAGHGRGEPPRIASEISRPATPWRSGAWRAHAAAGGRGTFPAPRRRWPCARSPLRGGEGRRFRARCTRRVLGRSLPRRSGLHRGSRRHLGRRHLRSRGGLLAALRRFRLGADGPGSGRGLGPCSRAEGSGRRGCCRGRSLCRALEPDPLRSLGSRPGRAGPHGHFGVWRPAHHRHRQEPMQAQGGSQEPRQPSGSGGGAHRRVRCLVPGGGLPHALACSAKPTHHQPGLLRAHNSRTGLAAIPVRAKSHRAPRVQAQDLN